VSPSQLRDAGLTLTIVRPGSPLVGATLCITGGSVRVGVLRLVLTVVVAVGVVVVVRPDAEPAVANPSAAIPAAALSAATLATILLER
jgi:hypothetical protein